jgi:phosphohistidine phosphatase SixA
VLTVGYGPGVTIFLVRHAHAGKRSEWDDDDTIRPLSERGEAQTVAITLLLADRNVRRVVSSPYLRCLKTVEPIAAKSGVDVVPDERLAEGAEVDAALELLLSLDRHHGVACSHGDLIPELLRELVAMGMSVDGPLLDQKGSVWTIHTRDGKPTKGRYTPPGA